jgi:Fe-S cluster biogenesis protein NfuA
LRNIFDYSHSICFYERIPVGDGANFQERVKHIGDLVQQFEVIADPAVRSSTKDLLQSLMDLHGSAIERILEVVSESSDSGVELIERLARDSMVSSLLVLYNLHPEEVDTRIFKAVEKVKPQLRKQGAEVEIIELHEGVVKLRVRTGGHTCGSTVDTIRTTLEGAVYDAAPDLTLLTLDGLDAQGASGFVALDQLQRNSATSLLAVPAVADQGA